MTAHELRALVRYLTNESPLAIVCAVYGDDADANYLEEKAIRVRRDPLAWIASLDSDRLSIFAALVSRPERTS